MPKGYIEAQNGVKLEIVDATARADVSAAKSQLAKLVQPSGALEIKENGTFDVLKYAQAIVNISGSGCEDGSGDAGNSGGTFIAFLYTQETGLHTSADGWSADIPHSLGRTPDWAIVMRTTHGNNASYPTGWIGYVGANGYISNSHTTSSAYNGKNEAVDMQNTDAKYLFADAQKLTIKTPGWGGAVPAGTQFFVACGMNEEVS